jgi:DNA-binding transcriptional LysR family regulator
MDPRRVLTFRAVARERSFSAAARTLALTQPAVSQQVAALESELGAQLIDRRPGGMELTRAGTILLAHADAIAERLRLAETQLGELAGPGRLRIGAFSSALAALVPRAVGRLGEAGDAAGRGVDPAGRPGDPARRGGDPARRGGAAAPEILVVEGDSQALAERVRGGELHLSVAFQDAALERREHDGLVRHDLLREPFLVGMSTQHPLAGRETVELRDLEHDPWTAASTDGLIARACRDAGFEPRLVAITRDPIAIREFLARGTAVTLVPRMLAPGLDGVAFAKIEGGPERDVYALLPPGGRHPLVEPTLAALAEVASELA